MKSEFIHLHCHSHYSLLDGLAKIDNLIEKAKEYDLDALALTDHGAMYGVIEFYQKCQEAGIKPIIGVEVYLAPRKMQDKQPKIDTNPHHLVLLCQNEEGYQNLIKLVSEAHLLGYYYKPRIDKDLLKKYSKGLIGLTACLQGEIPTLLLSGKISQAEGKALEYQDIFGKNNFYLELQDHPNLPDQKLANQRMISLSKKTKIPLVCSNDIHYLNLKDQEAHEVLLCVQTGKTLDDEKRLSMKGEDFSFKSPERMEKAFKEVPEAIENTQKIAEKCNLELSLGKFILPKFDLPYGKTTFQYLNELCQKGLFLKFGKNPKREIKDRLLSELEIIKKSGFQSYFLIVQDFCRWAKENGIAKGPGRGSSASSLVSYLLGITDVDPLENNLLFERFLSKEGERVAPPDIDLDFAEDRRNEVIDYLTKKYGKEHVAQIVTFGTMMSRGAVRDTGRALHMSYSEVDEIAKLIPFGLSLNQATSASPLLSEKYEKEPKVKRLIDLALQLEGVARHVSTHAAGVVISYEPLIKIVPLQKEVGKEENIITQYSMYDLEAVGLLKMDILGLANLTIIQNTLRILRKTKNIDLNISKIPLLDQKTFSLLAKGETQGVFQLESEGMKRWLKELKPTNLSDIIAMIALYRPGPMRWLPDYIAAKHARKKPNYIHPKLEPILKETYGVPVFQEQILQIARDLASFTYSEADVLRKAIGKKIKKLLLSQKEKFIKGCLKNNVKEEIALKIFDFIEPFARYSFNKAHSTCYAHIAYQTAYLKANFPSEFMAAYLTNEQNDLDKLSVAISEAERMGIKVLPPDINESWPDFAVVKNSGDIRFGLAAIKNVGRGISEKIVEERQANGKYKALEDLIKRTAIFGLNKKIIESLAKSGTLDSFSERTRILAGVDQILKFAQQAQKTRQTNQPGLFGNSSSLHHFITSSLPNVPPASKSQKLAWEKELLGMYISEHPLTSLNHIWKKGMLSPISSITFEKVGEKVKIAGIITKVQKVMTKTKQPMVFAKIEDISSQIEVLIFPEVLKKYENIFQEEKMVILGGKVSEREGNLKILVDSVKEMAEELKTEPEKKENTLYLTIPKTGSKGLLYKIKEIIDSYPGKTPIILRISENEEVKEIKVKSKVKISDILLEKLRDLLGKEKVMVGT